ncbi:mediator of RNA polymerase II transcription subunit 28-like [Pecten maximus]|uniref:mediator of RNA polymerase II transcription subunit 28-like n=1 Tax=Pecten maximus TaxID=6579 RepID=UPI001458D339|nr:mediator of RNA polymerase II transcription subunit 28-like [Pecten maximus]XP_033757544.1 mediator of RNA polymerase II transcription subunit 28-like [Pecten maximus]
MASANPERPQGGANGNLIDDLESAFQGCVSLLTSQEYFNVTDSEETKAGVDQSLQKFLDLARQTEAFFLHKRLVLSKTRPEQDIKDSTEELKVELERKDQLVKRHQERLQKWQGLLNSVARGPGGGVPAHGSQTMPLGPPGQGPANMPHPHGQTMPNPAQMNIQGQGYNVNQPQGATQIQGQNPQMMMQRPAPGHQGMVHNPPPAYPQGPLAYLEQTMSAIGMPERR